MLSLRFFRFRFFGEQLGSTKGGLDEQVDRPRSVA